MEDLIPLDKKIIKQLETANSLIPGYKKKYHNINRKFSQYTLRDFKKVPLLHKEELMTSQPFEFVNPQKIKEIISIHSTSGSTSVPIYVFYTLNDWKNLIKSMGKAFEQMGINRYQRVLQAFPNGLPSAGSTNEDSLKYFNKKLVINIGIGPSTETLFEIGLLKLKAEIFMGTPSTLIINGFKLKSKIGNCKNLLKGAVLIGEILREEQRKLIRQIFGDIEIHCALGQAESHTVLGDCKYCSNNEIHLEEDLLFHEFIKENNEYAEIGEYGEHIITSFDFEAQPLIRYCTGDWMKVADTSKRCLCGKKTFKVSLPIRRQDSLLKIKGILINPSVVYEIIQNVMKNNFVDYQLEVSLQNGKDFVRLVILVLDQKKIRLEWKENLNKEIKKKLGIHFNNFELTSEREDLVKGSYKIRNILDLRN